MSGPGDLARRLGNLPFPLGSPTWPDSVPRPSRVRRVGLDYDHAWARRYPARLARAVIVDTVTRPTVKALAPASVRGLEHLERLEGPVIFAANHASHLDTALLLTHLPERFRHHVVIAAASDYFFDRTWKATMWALTLNAIPIERSKVERRSAATAEALLEEGWNLIIFPEGGRSPDGWMQPFKAGAAYLSVKTGLPVVPVYLEGTQRIIPRTPSSGATLKGGSGTEGKAGPGITRRRTSVTFGRAIRPEPGESARRMAPRLEAAVRLLGREVATDFWTARRSPDDEAVTGPLEASPWRRAWALPSGEPAERPWPKP